MQAARRRTGKPSRPDRRGLTLVEVVVAVSVMGVLAVAVAGLLETSLRMRVALDERTTLVDEGLLALERITREVGATTHVFAPNGRGPVRDVLMYSAGVNADGDAYFGDPLFPRVDEDPGEELVADGRAGIRDFDDDGDGHVDESGDPENDDEDFWEDEDPVDGEDNDHDGSVDEDPGEDVNGDGESGVAGMDDDGDGQVDEADEEDDDEDGTADEDGPDPAAFYHVASDSTLRWRRWPAGDETVVCRRVTAFQATYHAPGFHNAPFLDVQITLVDASGSELTLIEVVAPENYEQRCGKRVR